MIGHDVLLGELRPSCDISLTFRIRGVPLNWDIHELQTFLAKQYDSASPVVRSLAVEIHGRSCTATVSFCNVPCQLQSGQSWRISLPAISNQSAGSLTLDTGFLGITTLYAPPPQDHEIDVIAVSGLGGHAFGSFKERGGEHMWIRDALPHDLGGTGGNGSNPLARIMVYGYESHLPQSNSFQSLEDLGSSFHNSLLALATSATLRPIIFVAHSLGGLIVKQMLISLSRSTSKDDQALIRAVYGIVFFGVPHAGMDISSLIPMVENGPNRFFLESIGNINSQIISTLQREFLAVLGSEGEPEIVSFYETVKSPTAKEVEKGKWAVEGPGAVLVTKASATLCRPSGDGQEHICAVDRSHSEMIKFGPQDHEYEKALVRINGLVRRALAKRM
ncbi:hypothetical protein GQ53DRAFT_799429 [Thozetella sp. PMI_491]|nr:hypothetical protein GQ53DRAFT_799429 [Thozetella sp. PMI_491]